MDVQILRNGLGALPGQLYSKVAAGERGKVIEGIFGEGWGGLYEGVGAVCVENLTA